MKRISFSPAILLSVVSALSLPAAAETPPAADKDKETPPPKEAVRTPVDGLTLANLGVTAMFNGKSIQYLANFPKICVDSLEMTNNKIERVTDGKVATTEADLKALSTKVTPEFSFLAIPANKDTGLPEMKTLQECLAKADKLEKINLPKDRFSKEILNGDERAYLAMGKVEAKSGAYIKAENDIKLITCVNCNEKPEDQIANLKKLSGTDEQSFSGIIAKTAEEPIGKFLSRADSATSCDELTSVSNDLIQYSKDLDQLSIAEADRKSLRGKIYEIVTRGLPAKAMLLGKDQQPAAGQPSVPAANGDPFAAFRKSVGGSKEPAQSVSASYLACSTAIISKATASIPGIDAAVKKQDQEIAKQLVSKNSEIRLAKLAEMNPADPEILEAGTVAAENSQKALTALNQQCGATLQRTYPTMSPSQRAYNFTLCSNLYGEYQRNQKLILSIPNFQAALSANSLSWNGNGMSYSTNNLVPGNPYAAAQTTAQNGASAQNSLFDPSKLYSPQGNWNSASPTVINNTSGLPTAIPLNGASSPQQQFNPYQRYNQFQS